MMAQALSLEQDIQYLKGVGPKRAAQLKKIGIATVADLAAYYPRAYEDRSVVTPIAELDAESDVAFTVIGVIVNAAVRNFGAKKSLITATVSDGTGYLQAPWFNQPFMKEQLKTGRRILLYGRVGYAYGGTGMLAMTRLISYEFLESGESVPKQGILPVYPLTELLNQKFLRTIVKNLWQSPPPIPEVVPAPIRARYALLNRAEALKKIHFPAAADEAKAARDTLAFEELYLIQCGLLLLKKDAQTTGGGIRCLVSSNLVKKALAALPFTLTPDQASAWRQIEQDMEKDVPMRRLLEGDVGSGKTAIALLALVKAVENGYQGAFMAPTEILARQHYEKFSAILTGLKIKIALLTGELTAKNRKILLEEIANNEINIVIGTHAILEEAVKFAALGLAVTDEQHRFGVNQRGGLAKKGDKAPDVLVMTATPIPRTMTLTIYGDLDISRIEHLPPGRRPVRTFVREYGRRPLIYDFVKKELLAGRQAYVVCPLIEESEALPVPSAEEVFKELKGGIFRDMPIALVHGRLKKAEKNQLMDDFYAGKIKLIVATTVIEVGVDVPNASIMVIENADRFGLAQLHQLRGRIGRGAYQSYCVLVSSSSSPIARERLEVMRTTSSGFEIAEADLRLRGAGQFFGTMQHGAGDLKIVNIISDLDILEKARRAAQETIADAAALAAVRPLIAERYKGNFQRIKE